MLTTFHQLLTYQMAAPLIIRIVLGISLVWIGYNKTKTKSHKNATALGVAEVVIGFFIFIGLFTQIAAILASIVLAIKLGHKVKHRAFLTDGVNYYLLLLAMAVSLIFSTAGFLAFDLPL